MQFKATSKKEGALTPTIINKLMLSKHMEYGTHLLRLLVDRCSRHRLSEKVTDSVISQNLPNLITDYRVVYEKGRSPKVLNKIVSVYARESKQTIPPSPLLFPHPFLPLTTTSS